MARILDGDPNRVNHLSVLQDGVLEMRVSTEFAIAVEGGAFGSVWVLDPTIAKIGPPLQRVCEATAFRSAKIASTSRSRAERHWEEQH
jgi:hypothetical protein